MNRLAAARAALESAPELLPDNLSDQPANSGISGNRNHWPEALPLRRKLPEPDPYPLQALGELLGPVAQAIVNALQCPDALAGQSVLAAAALAVQPFADVAIDGRTSPLSLYFITIAASGERKSSVDRLACQPHRNWALTERDRYERRMKDWAIELAAWKKAYADILKNAKGQAEAAKGLRGLGDEPIRPLEPVIFTEEPTYEGLVKLIGAERPSLGLYSDEGARFLGGFAMSSDNAIKTAAGLSKLWDGDPITRTRAGDGHSILYGRRLSMHLMIQPTIVPLLYGNRALTGQGLLSRVLAASPVSTIGRRLYRAFDVADSPAFQAYEHRITSILDSPLPIRADTRNTLVPRLIDLTADAKTEFVRFHDHVERLCAHGRELESVRGFAAKAAEHALRIAGVLTLISDPAASAIALSGMACGIKLAQFHVGEALRLLGVATANPDLILAEQVLTWARNRGHQFATTTLYQRGPNAVRDKAAAHRILAILVDHGWIRALPPGAKLDGKRRRNAWEVRP